MEVIQGSDWISDGNLCVQERGVMGSFLRFLIKVKLTDKL